MHLKTPISRAQVPFLSRRDAVVGTLAASIKASCSGALDLTPAPDRVLRSQPWNAAKFGSGSLRGFNIGRSSADDLAALVQTGANLIRTFVELRRSPGEDVYALDALRVVDLDRLIAFAAANGLKVVIVLEPLPNQFAQQFWGKLSLQNSIVQIWRVLAKKYFGNEAVGAFDLINEPITKRPWNHGGQEEWLQFASRIVLNIREVDPTRIVILEPSPGGLPVGYKAMDRVLPFDEVVYSAHVYQPHAFTHQGLHGYKVPYKYPGLWSSAMLSESLEPIRRFAERFRRPILIGEFSAVRWAPDHSAARYVADAVQLFEAEKWSWTYHAWREYQAWDAELPESWFYSFDYHDAKPQGFESVDQAALRSATATINLLRRQFRMNAP
jgi:aryl-phospho-beta-D-glucosidase BglC (GH1 family)